MEIQQLLYSVQATRAECLCVNNKMASAPKEPRTGKLFLLWANTVLYQGPWLALAALLAGVLCAGTRVYTLPGRKPGKVCILVCLN